MTVFQTLKHIFHVESLENERTNLRTELAMTFNDMMIIWQLSQLSNSLNSVV